MAKRVYNFNAGPATLPVPVLERAKDEMLDWENTGMSVMEVSHRSKEYDAMHHEAMSLVKELMGWPDGYKVLWLQGGASTQFLMVPQNLSVPGKPMEYVNTGAWSKKAIKEAKLFGEVKVVASSEDKNFSYIPKDVSFSEDAAFAHITGNNTIFGTEWHYDPKVPSDVPLVVDMSSNLMDKVIDVKRIALLYAGVQKNLGPAGVTLAVIREDLLPKAPEKAPTMLKYSTHAAEDSLFNTPPCWAIYMCKLVLEYMKEKGGVPYFERINREKAKLLYDAIENSGGFYKGHADPDSRSLMNVTFKLPTEDLEKQIVDEAKKTGMVGLKGHRSVGGMRASIYNAMSMDGVKHLVEFLKDFQAKNQ
ncbi:MAG: 3-phosphoserine/phosphohydroxythreonine transaminase [Candidatus Thermoplasmatota archaeon]|nr:3-phosphoserine/phosphohydroxythreonine transaminase [Candidatus Thermoplasmatota archaeon]